MSAYCSDIELLSLDISDEYSYEDIKDLLSVQRQGYCERKKLPAPRMCSAWGYLLLRYYVYTRLGCSAKPELTFGSQDKPYTKDICFNISHSGSRVICAFSGSDVGADIQDIRSISDSAARKFCTENELSALPDDEAARGRELCRIWCLKESRTKLSGGGFSEGFTGFEADELIKKGQARISETDGFFVCVSSAEKIGSLRETRLSCSEVIRTLRQAESRICFIFGAGDDYPYLLPPMPKNSFKIAADGGLARLSSLGIKPDWVIGDFDSLGEVPKGDNVTVLPCVKDTTDTDEAVTLGLAKGCRRFFILGGTGGRLDHTLANIQLIARLSQSGVEASLIGRDFYITAVTDRTLTLPARECGYVSVFAFTEKCEGVTISGLKYEIADTVLTNTFALGVSNEFIGKNAFISVKNGTLIIYHQNKTTAGGV